MHCLFITFIKLKRMPILQFICIILVYSKMFIFNLFIRIILISVVYRSIIEIRMFNKKQQKQKKIAEYMQKKDLVAEYKQYLYEYNIEKNKYDALCSYYNSTSEIMNNYKQGCIKIVCVDDYYYKGLWENNTQNGFGMYMYNDKILISGNRKNNKYNGMVKIHIEDFPENIVLNFHCVYAEGERKKCYINDKNGSTYSITNDKLNELKLFDFI